MKNRTLTETLGWYGFAAILGSYALSNIGMLAVDSGIYRILNLSGALALIADSWPDRNWQIIILNAVWAAIAVFTLLR
jgi:hypothetical protein